MTFFGPDLRNGLPIGLGSVAGFGIAPRFSPASLFTGGVNGAWYDPSDSTTLFSDRAGTTPCGTPGGGSVVPVGRMLDKSGNGNHATAANDTTARPELRAVVNLLNGSATLATQSVTTVATTYTLYFTGSGSITLSGTATGTYVAGSSSVVCTAGTLTLTVSGTVTTADLRPANSGAQLPVYQARTDANTYDAVGFPRYLTFNGTSSAMSTPANVNLSGTDKATVFAGVRKIGTSIGVIIEAMPAYNQPGGMAIFANTVASNDYGAALQNGYITGTAYTPPITNVVTASFDIAAATLATEITMRVNGATPTTATTGSASTGNFGNLPYSIGVRNLTTVFFNGNIYSLIVVGSAVSAGNITSTEQWVAGKVGITI